MADKFYALTSFLGLNTEIYKIICAERGIYD